MKKLFILTLILAFIAPYNLKAMTLNFSVTPVKSNYQYEDISSYYKLKLPEDSKGKDISLEFDIENMQEKEIRVTVIPTNALTSPSADIFYTPELKTTNSGVLDDSFAVGKNIKVDKLVTLEPKEKKRLKVVFNTPKEAGTYLGGLLFTEVKQITSSDSKEFITMENTLPFAMALQADVGLVKQNKDEKLQINKSYFQINNENPVLVLEVENNTKGIVDYKDVSYKLESDVDKTNYVEEKINLFKFAPKSYSNIMIPLHTITLKDLQNYTLTVKIGDFDYKYTKSLKLEYPKNMITNDTKEPSKIENTMNQNGVDNQEKLGVNYWYTVILIFPILFIVFFIKSQRKKKQREDRRKQRRKELEENQ